MSRELGENLTKTINPDNSFYFIVDYLSKKDLPSTRKALGHELVGLIATFRPNLAFEKYVLPAADIDGITGRLTDLFGDNSGQNSIGIATCYKNDREAMGKAPYWYGRRGKITPETLNRFLSGENTENGQWDISNQERQQYPWLVEGYTKALRKYPISESVVTVHPPGYDADRKTHFVGRIWINGLALETELKLGTTLLRDLNEETSPHEIIELKLNSGQMRIGSSYILNEILDKDSIRQLLAITNSITQTEAYSTEYKWTIIKQLIGALKSFKDSKTPVVLKANIGELIKSFIQGLQAGMMIMQNPQNQSAENFLKIKGLETIESLGKKYPEEYEELVKKIRLQIKASTSSVQETFFHEGSLFLLEDLFRVISAYDFTQLEIIGGVTPTGERYAKIYEIS